MCLCAIPVTRTLTRDASSLLLRFSSCLHAAAPGQGPAGANSRPRHTQTHKHTYTHTRRTRHRSLGRQRHTLRHINTHTHDVTAPHTAMDDGEKEKIIIMCALLPALLRVCVRPLEVVCCSSAGGYPELGPHLHTHTLNISTFHSPASIKWLPKRVVVMNGSRSVTQLHQKHIEHIGPRQGAAVCMGAAFDYSIRLRKTFDRYRSNRRRYGNH